MTVTREEQSRKARLAQVRQNDAAHEAMMQEAAQKAGVSLSEIRGMSMKAKDERLAAMLRMARGAA